MIFDGDCAFCRRWIGRWRRITAERVEYRPFQDESIARMFPEIPRENFTRSVQLIARDGLVYSGAEAVVLSLAENPALRWLPFVYQKIPGISAVFDITYRFVANHRS